jgi:osmotically-inducible protein OsmY
MIALAAIAAAALAGGCGPQPADRTLPPQTSAARDSVTDKIDDATITTKVTTAMLADANTRSLKIDVDTKDGVVTLNGSVDTKEHRERAKHVAQGVAGVKQVVDNLRVTG